MKKLVSIILLIALIFSFSACQNTLNISSDNSKLQVMTAMFAEYDFARQIAGEYAQVQMLLPPGADMHSYEPTPKDIINIKNCDIFIYGGGESDSWLDDVLDSLGENITTVKMMDACELLHEDEHAEESHGHDEEEYDEHVWTSPKNAIKIVDAITEALCFADSKNADAYSKNKKEYINKLNNLDKNFKFVIDNAKRHELIFADRFPLLYFAEEYGLEYFSAFPGCSHSNEASAGKVRELIDRVRVDDIPVVFKIELSSDSLAQTVASETGAIVLEFNSCHSITRSQLENGETYLSLMEQNLENLKIALN